MKFALLVFEIRNMGRLKKKQAGLAGMGGAEAPARDPNWSLRLDHLNKF